MSEADTISVEVSDERVIAATTATAHLRLTGASLVRGGEAHRKAKEIAELAAALEALGLDPDQLRVVDVIAQQVSGILGKSSSVTYRLTVEAPIEALPALVGAIAGQRNLTLERMTFGYDDVALDRDAWAAALARRALARATVIADALSIPILGVRSLDERFQSGEPQPMMAQAFFRDDEVSRSKGAAPIDPGVPLTHEKTVSLTLNVAFRVGPRET